MLLIAGILASAFLLDLIMNDGNGLTNIISSFRGKINQEPPMDNIGFAKELLEEIGSLREDLEFNNTPEEKETIVQKIKDRQRILDKLF